MAKTNDRLIYQAPHFDGGLNNKYTSNIIGDNESGDCKNIDTDDTGSVRTRYGSTALTHGTLATGTWYGGTTYQPPTGNSQLIGWYNSSMLYLSGVTWVTVPSADGVFTQQTHVAYDVLDGYLCMGDGGIPYKWNGTEFTRLGVEVPPGTFSVATAATAGTAGVSGTLMYKIGFVNSAGVVGNISSAKTIVLGAGSAIVSLASIPTAVISYGINARNIYRTLANGEDYFFVTQIADNTTSTYQDETIDADLVEEAPLDQGLPPHFKILKTHKSRLFAVDNTDTSVVKYSEISNPYVFKSVNTEPINEGSGTIKMLGTESDAVVIGKNNNETWLLYLADNDPENWFPIKTNSPYGTTSAFNLNIDDQLLMFGTLKDKPMGFISLKGVNPINETIGTDIGNTRSILSSDRIEPDIFSLTSSRITDIRGIHWQNKALISVPFGALNGNNRVYLYDFQRRDMPREIGAWVPWTGLNISYFTIYNDLLYGFPSGEGTSPVIQLDKTDLYSDSGVAIDSYFETKFFSGGKDQDETHKDFRWLYLWVTLLGSWNMDVRTRVDFDTTVGAITVLNLTTSGAMWDSATWDTDSWTQTNSEKEFIVDLGKLNGRRIKFRFTNQNTAGQAFKVNRAAFEYILRTRRRISG